MKRPIGVFIAGVILLVSGLLGLVLFSLGVLGTMATSSLQTTMTPAARAVVYVTEASFAAFSVFCGWVAIDLFRLRAWARYASIVLAALAACFFGLSAILLTLLRNMPLPEQNLPPHLIEHIFLGLALLYFVIAAIGLFWVVYFNRASIRGAFAAAEAHRQGEDAFGGVILPNPAQHKVVGFSQIVVWVVAVMFVLGGVSMIVLMLLGTPMFLLGWMTTGALAFLMEVLWCCFLFYAGLGLLLRWRAGWFVAVGLQLYSILSVGLLLLPGYATRLVGASQILTARLLPGAHPAPDDGSFLVASSAVGGLVAVGILVALFRCRQDYLS